MTTQKSNLQINLNLLACLMLAVQEEQRSLDVMTRVSQDLGHNLPTKPTWFIMAEEAIETALATSQRQTAIHSQLIAFVRKVAELGMSHGDKLSVESVLLFQLWQDAERLLNQIHKP